MRKERDVHVLEHARANEEGLPCHLFFGNTGPQHECARNVIAFHDLFHDDGRRDIEWHARVVAFAMARCTGDHRVVVSHAGFLAGLRNVVDVAAQGDHGLARSPAGDEGGGHTAHAALHLEAILLEQSCEIPGRLDLLHAEFAEGEHLIDHHLNQLRLGIDFPGGLGLERVELRSRGVLVLDRVCAGVAAALGRGDAWAQQRDRQRRSVRDVSK